MRVGFVCMFGMSTYYILKLVEKTAKDKNIDLVMEAIPISELNNRIRDFDMVLLGPQLKYKLSQVKEIADKNGKKSLVIPSDIYGSMDGDKLLNFILESL